MLLTTTDNVKFMNSIRQIVNDNITDLFPEEREKLANGIISLSAIMHQKLVDGREIITKVSGLDTARRVVNKDEQKGSM